MVSSMVSVVAEEIEMIELVLLDEGEYIPLSSPGVAEARILELVGVEGSRVIEKAELAGDSLLE